MSQAFYYLRNIIRFFTVFRYNSKSSYLSLVLCGVSVSAVLFGCSENKWSDAKENFTQTYFEILVAREQITDSVKAQNAVQTIMENHGFDEQTFALQFMEYSHTPDQLKSILDSAQARARREIKTITDSSSKHENSKPVLDSSLMKSVQTLKKKQIKPN